MKLVMVRLTLCFARTIHSACSKKNSHPLALTLNTCTCTRTRTHTHTHTHTLSKYKPSHCWSTADSVFPTLHLLACTPATHTPHALSSTPHPPIHPPIQYLSAGPVLLIQEAMVSTHRFAAYPTHVADGGASLLALCSNQISMCHCRLSSCPYPCRTPPSKKRKSNTTSGPAYRHCLPGQHCLLC